MHLFKFSLIFLVFSSSVFAMDDNECLKSSFDVEVIHKGQPFGLLPVKLKIQKKECILNISHERLKFLKKNWEVDICREPVHIKSGRGAVEVLKKTSSCEGKSSSSFCSEQNKLFQVIQDDGLIFAPGEKENLSTDHGRVYCSYLLVKKYLAHSLIFNRGEDYSGTLLGRGHRSQQKAEIPSSVPTSIPRPEMDSGSPDEGSATPEMTEQPSSEENGDEAKKGTGSF